MASLTPEEQIIFDAVYDAVMEALHENYTDVSSLPDGDLSNSAFTLPVVIDHVLKKVQASSFSAKTAELMGEEAYLLIDKATPATTPVTPSYKCYYLAASEGTYTGFLDAQGNAIVVSANDIALLMYDPSDEYWTKKSIDSISAIIETASDAAENADTQADRAKAYADNPWEIRNDGYIWVYDETLGTMTRTNKMIVDPDEIDPEIIAQAIASVGGEDLLAPTYDAANRSITFPLSARYSYDAQAKVITIG